MDMPILTGFVFGRLWAERRNVQSPAAQNRAGMLMAIGGRANPALGLVMANESIDASASTPAPSQPPSKGSKPATTSHAADGGISPPGSSPKIAATITLDETTRRVVRTAAQEVGRAAKAVEGAAKAQSSSAAAAMRMLGPDGGRRSKARTSEGGDITIE